MNKVLIVAFILALSTPYAASAGCKIFSCGSLDHTGEIDPLLSCADGTKATSIPLEVCKDGYSCASLLWGTPDAAISKVSCLKNADPGPDPTPDNTVLPGDICTADAKCYSNAKGVKCTGGKCVTPVKVGDDCAAADTKLCPENSYCDGTNKWVVALDVTKPCTKATPCKSGLGCMGNADGSAYTWQKMGLAANAAKFKIDNIYLTTFLISQSSFCASYNSFDTGAGVRECRPGDTSTDKNESDLKRGDVTPACKFGTYNDATATATTPVNKEEPPRCGFNTDASYYCNKRIGDSYFQGTYTKMKALDLTSYTCHVNSGWTSCQSFVVPNKDLLIELLKRQYEVQDGGYARVANNDKCAKKDITIGYWITVPDSSFGYSVVSTLAAVLAIVSMIAMF